MTSRKSVNLLPSFLRTEKNNKFLSSTLDQLISPPEITRIDAYVGSKDTPSYRTGDEYLQELDPIRSKYQLEPALVIRTLTRSIKKAFALDDLLNQVKNNGIDSSNVDRIINPKFYSYDPKISWDKFVNFREYYWLPAGPSAIEIAGRTLSPVTEFNIVDAEDKIQFLFDAKTTSPTLTLYRGATYVFNINSQHNFYIKYTNSVGSNDSVFLTNNGTNNGQIIFTVDWSAPDRLFYVSNDDQLSTGNIIVKDPIDSSLIDVENEVVGKQHYTSGNGVTFIDGIKVRFSGTVIPETYKDNDYIVEGVGNAIKLVKFTDLDTPDATADAYNSRFDGTNFDQFPFDNFKNIPLVPEYVTINRASKDLNPWSRYNRWFHSDVIREVAKANNQLVVYPAEYRATRPIIEFIPDLQLYKFGNTAIPNVDLIDTFTTNIFKTIEREDGYDVDQITLEEGFRVVFNADSDPSIRGKIFKVTFAKFDNKFKINLTQELDIPIVGTSVLIKKGIEHGGSSWYYDGTTWIKGQQRTKRNQAPLFDLFDEKGISYSSNAYTTDFKGNALFGYGIGYGTNDPVLGFPLAYRSIGIEGTYLFKNYFVLGSIQIVNTENSSSISTAQTYFKINNDAGTVVSNIWSPVEPYEIPNVDGIYDAPLNLTNNPSNKNITEFTLTELSDHVQSMVSRDPEFNGTFPGISNLKDLPFITRFGTRLITNINPLSFAQHFVTDNDNSVINAMRLVGENYQTFKFNLIRTISDLTDNLSPIDALDEALRILNQNKTTTFPYYSSDMIPYGVSPVIRTYRITDSRKTKYALPPDASVAILSSRGLLVYLNTTQLIRGRDYKFDDYDANVEILVPIVRGDVITIKDYPTTDGNFVPPTPSKLGLYPAYEPAIFEDDSYINGPKTVIQGHDGSITIAFGDYRDEILLEYEKRVYNNIGTEYKPDIFDINAILPGIFRNSKFSYGEVFKPVLQDFLKWKSAFGVEIEKNLTFDVEEPKTYNYSSVELPSGEYLPGNWRAIFKLYFDTDRPHVCPWEMLGFSVKPTWWETEYGPAPYTSGNTKLWKDLQLGKIAQGTRKGVDPHYTRPDLINILPVDSYGKLIPIRNWGILTTNGSIDGVNNNWKFGDMGSAETAWRRSSYWPFALQIISALTSPATYTSLMFDTSRMIKNSVGELVYSNDNLPINSSKVILPYETINGQKQFASGYSVIVIEAGLIKNSNYITNLKLELTNAEFNLMNKVGGFISKDKLEVVIDSVSPNSINPGILLPTEDYSIHFNVSNPIDTIEISGVILQKIQGYYVVRGYDKTNAYFKINSPIRQQVDLYINVGATSEEYTPWSSNVFYSTGQVILNNNVFYRVSSNHNSGLAFDSLNYQKLTALPTVGGTTAQLSTGFEDTETTVPYGTVYQTQQDVVDFLLGYSRYLTNKGFVFDEYSEELGEILDWKLSIKEFLFWTTQNWNEANVITLSPFANKVKLITNNAVVDNIFNPYYEYSIYKANGTPFPYSDVSLNREDGYCTISINNELEGIFYVKLRLVQKEHAIILNNLSRFNDVIYDTATGYRQRRIRLIGFRTANWKGNFASPGFVYDDVKVTPWESYKDYIAGDVVEYAGKYYSLVRSLAGQATFDFSKWYKLDSKPTAQLIPNFEYKINQFEDFYSLDIDNFDISQQQLAQHLIGYSSRVYLDNIFLNPIAQYKFFQGFIREKGTRNALKKLERASVHNLQGNIEFNEEWAFRIGTFGAFGSLDEIEFPLNELDFVDNSQIVKFVEQAPNISYDPTNYITPDKFTIKNPGIDVSNLFKTVPPSENEELLVLPYAGYATLEDVDYTVVSKAELISGPVNSNIKVGDTVWIGFDDNEDWGIYRYSRLPIAVKQVYSYQAGEKISFVTDKNHGLKVGDVVAIVRFATTLDRTYIISEINRLDEFVVDYTESVPDFVSQFGLLFKFVSSRFNTFDDIINTTYLADFKQDKKVWIDNNISGDWEVYEKTNNYSISRLPNIIDYNYARYGQVVKAEENSNILIVGAPDYDDGNGSGKVFVYTNVNGVLTQLFYYGVNKFLNQYYNNNLSPSPKGGFGTAIEYDPIDGYIIASAPYASYIRSESAGGTRFVSPTTPTSTYQKEGLVVISSVNSTNNGETRYFTLSCSEPENGLEFGKSLYVSNTTTHKLLFVGAPGKSYNAGAVYFYDLAIVKSVPSVLTFDDNLTTFDKNTCLFDAVGAVLIETNVTATSQIKLPTPPIVSAGSRFGEVISGNNLGTRLAVSAPQYNNGNGAVFVYRKSTTVNSYTLIQTLLHSDAALGGKFPSYSRFGASISMTDDGNWLIVSADLADDKNLEKGKVAVYKWSTSANSFVFSQLIQNPSSTNGLKFGHKVETDRAGEILVISAQGPNYFYGLTYDTGSTTFDAESTNFGAVIDDSGSAFVYNRYNDKFIYATELFDYQVDSGSFYGADIAVTRNFVYVGAPLDVTTGTTRGGQVFAWNAIDPLANTWKLIRQQSNLVDTRNIKSIKTIDSFNEQVLDYLEIYDPIKGFIPSPAENELRYKTIFDPAVYNTGTNTKVNIDITSYWGKEHVGELWWDLSTVKYMLYEQGDIDYRRNLWGNLFPGASIDVYEWVESDFIPSEWGISADTASGIAIGISGIPKHQDDSVYVEEQTYSSISDQLISKYYFWVRNSILVPNRQGRNISANEVAGYIKDPKSYGLRYLQVHSANSLSVVNTKETLVNERILLNIQLNSSDANKHTDWLLIEDGSANSLPNLLLEKKFIDSLLGRDSLGNVVPDPSLTARQKYGIQIRPRQSMFKDRLEALRNLISYVNAIFVNNLISDFYNLSTLNLKDEIPPVTSRDYDLIVEDLEKKLTISTKEVSQAEFTAVLTDGKITSVNIINPGFGYGKLDPTTFNENGDPIVWHGPTITIDNDVNGAIINTEINNVGSIINVLIKNSGKNYNTPPVLVVRPYTMIVQTDSNSKGRWTKYALINSEWEKIQTQSYDTTLYWDFIDWVSPEYNPNQAISATLDQIYQIPEIEVATNEYIKINNNGANRFIILKKVEIGKLGTYNTNFDIMYNEKGTIKIKDSIWKLSDSQLGFDQISPYDDTFFDQTPDVELEKIIYSLKNDLFTGNLKVYWNKFFFAGVKYALTEQKFIDWAFKTSFINVKNIAGELDQRPIYKFQDSQWYEDYLDEIKPFHTKVRNYKLNYSVTDSSDTFSTDFDLPGIYDKTLGKFKTLSADDIEAQQYPYKGWLDNYKLHLDKIILVNTGKGYTETPEVQIIPASGETVTRPATVKAVLSGGSILTFEILDSGEGYTTNPTVLIIGGGGSNYMPAKATAVMSNRKIRTNLISLKFDRISTHREVGSKLAIDQFTVVGNENEFILSWPALYDKANITLKDNGIIVLSSNYILEDFSSKVNGYSKQFTRLVLNYSPDLGHIVSITYPKSLKIYQAFDRIQDYYNPTPGMPGKDETKGFSQLMQGVEYPGTEISTQPFDNSHPWDGDPWGEIPWDILNYSVTGYISTRANLPSLYSGSIGDSYMTTDTNHKWEWSGTVWVDKGEINQDLDTLIDGGTFVKTLAGGFATAAGTTSTDIILDGDQFISPYRSHAPEESIPGEIHDSFSIDVFTRQSSGSGMIYTLVQEVIANQSTTVQLSIKPPNYESITVTLNHTLLQPRADYSINFLDNTLFVSQKIVGGTLEITYMEFGGTGFLSKDSAIVDGDTEGAVIGSCAYRDVKSVFVSVNGVRIYPQGTFYAQLQYFELTRADAKKSARAKITIYGLGIGYPNTITAIFFNGDKKFSEIKEQVWLNLDNNNRDVQLSQPPGLLGPASANSIVELNRRRLVPPNTTYYEITSLLQTQFDINTRKVYPANSFDNTIIEVYKNGVRIPVGKYELNQYYNRVEFPDNFFNLGDVLAITSIVDYDYIIRGNVLTISGRVDITGPERLNILNEPGYQGVTYLRAITFTNQDNSFIRTEVYEANSSRIYKLTRVVVNDNFVWVSIGDKVLTSGYDFEIMEDLRTIRIDPDIPYNDGEQVIITSFTEQVASLTIGYKIFRDILGRTHYKRLSSAETTYLTQALLPTSTTITVNNGAILPTPALEYKTPGVVFVAGERIEYLEKHGNTLSKLRRGTLGTGVKEQYGVGTWVIDQSRSQTIPFAESVIAQTFTNTGVISTFTLTHNKFIFASDITPHDAIEIFVGGVKLEKPLQTGNYRVVHDGTLSFDSGVNDTILEPDFTITTSTQAFGTMYTVNLLTPVDPRLTVSVVQRRSTTWYDIVPPSFTASLFDQNTVPATFIKQREAITPDNFYYGGDSVLRLDDGTALLLDDGREINEY